MPLDPTAAEALSNLLGARFSTRGGDRDLHAQSEAYHRAPPPDAVAWPETTAEVAAIMAICNAHRVPVLGWGAGTSLEGQALAYHGGLVLDMARMDRVLEIRAEDLQASVQPGVTREALNQELRATGLFFPVDPGANASLGGMASTRASGTTAVRYGTMRDNILALEVVLADGRVIRTGTRAAKSSAGYDLTGLFVGAEGTLGIITELTLRLHGQPEEVAAAVCGFDTLEQAVECVTATIQSAIPMARIEFIDADVVRAFNRASGTAMPEAPHLMVEFHGTPASVQADAQAFGALAEDFGGTGFDWATTPQDRAALWKMRHGAYRSCLALRPGATAVVTDVCVPMSHLPQAVADAARDIRDEGLLGPMIGHVGDGNFHAQLLVMPGNAEELAAAKRVATRMAERALAVGGTITGEHGIGVGKRPLMAAQHGEALDVMAAIKRALDPGNILNPGKLIPDEALQS
ncbi:MULTISPECIES: FAD-binding oxidoreductase [unclassified Paracoccus (in: a-proteobacteria)]|uniref:FAD-binding oxidoreductase n=1 Tax=unclassified Paracoccus (in: a-proteobacteria) TaxID=2688777 RepID=UPI0012B388A1|nr:MULTISPECIES: FAD-linked oxidase C-terminal domain-containing protein [unclassified Paracoccus (in: a-proteobacteria)]UXU75158.1 FAD-binding protein [Paracoccus sp. SMMA_5]UXU81060.1 FAD-binding protein [Paracoccus sp. SMMA_5_TC]